MKTKTYWNLGYLGLFSIICLVLFWDNIQQWTSQIPGYGEDGGKNYYTVAYQILHHSSAIWFEGMNYPFGEHVVFTDNQPLIANALALIGGSAYWLPYLAIVSALVGGFLIFSMLRAETKNEWYSLISSLGIIFLSPQWSRLTGHYSLAYVGLIPLAIYLLWKKHQSSKQIKWNVILLLAVYLFGWIHPYLLMMTALLWSLYALSNALDKTSRWKWSDILWPIACLVLFFVSLKLSDPINDRPQSPYGFINYRATWSSLLLPLDRPYFESIASNFSASLEGTFYLGITAIVGFFVGFFRFIRKRQVNFWVLLATASIPLLLLSVAFPFYLPKMDQLLQYLGPLQQFRGIGRFSFPVFFAFNLFAVVALFRLVEHRNKAPHFVGLGLILFVLSVEAFTYSNHIAKQTRVGHSFQEFDESLGYDQEFQCIMPIPYFHVGSETYRTPNIESLRMATFQLSLNHGLPTSAVQMSRTSLSQTLDQLQLTSFFAEQPTILNLYNEKPILLLTKIGEGLNQQEQKLLNHAEKFKSLDGFEYYAIKPSNFKDIALENKSKILRGMNMAESLSSASEAYLSFDNENTDHAFAGSGALQFSRNDWTEITPKNYVFSSNTPYELSFWFNVEQEQAANTQLWFWEREGDREINFYVTEIGDHIDQILDGWILCKIPFSVNRDGNQVSILVHRDGISQTLTIDEILLRDQSHNFYRPDYKNLNNRYVSQPNRP